MPINDQKHDTRQAILQELDRAGRVPRTIEDLVAGLELYLITAADIKHELPGLLDHEYVENLLRSRGQVLLRLTAKGRDQIRRDARLDEYIWGATALI